MHNKASDNATVTAAERKEDARRKKEQKEKKKKEQKERKKKLELWILEKEEQERKNKERKEEQERKEKGTKGKQERKEKNVVYHSAPSSIYDLLFSCSSIPSSSKNYLADQSSVYRTKPPRESVYITNHAKLRMNERHIEPCSVIDTCLYGTSMSLEKGKKRIADDDNIVIASNDRTAITCWKRNVVPTHKTHEHVETREVNPRSCRKLRGVCNSIRCAIETQFGVRIFINIPAVVVVGPKTHMERAMPIVDDLLFSDGATARKALENHVRNIYQNEMIMHRDVVPCDKDLAGCVIGKEGKHIKSFIPPTDMNSKIEYDEVNSVFEIYHPDKRSLERLKERFNDHVTSMAAKARVQKPQKHLNISG